MHRGERERERESARARAREREQKDGRPHGEMGEMHMHECTIRPRTHACLGRLCVCVWILYCTV